MTLDYRDTVEAIEEGVRAALRPDPDDDVDPVIGTIPIQPFDAVDIDDKPLRVVGVIIRRSGLTDFATLYQDMTDGGAIYANVNDSGIYPTKEHLPFPRMYEGE